MAGEGEPRKVSTCLVRVVPRRSTASQLPQMFSMDQKRSRGKRSEWALNDEDNEYLCMPRWDKFYGVRDREEIDSVEGGHDPKERALLGRADVLAVLLAEIIVRSSLPLVAPLVSPLVAPFFSSYLAKFGFTFMYI